MSKRPSYVNGSGNEMEYGWFHVPLWYSGIINVNSRGKSRELVVMEIGPKHVVYTHKNVDNYRVGIMKRTKLLKDVRGSYFVYRGDKIYFSKRSGWVM